MTQAFNLAQLANNLNTSGQIDASDGLFGTLPTTLFPNSGVSAGSYSNANVVVDQYGRITSATNGSGVLQILQAYKNDSFSTTSGSYVDVTGLSITITPSKTTSKILVLASAWVSGTDNQLHSLRLVRNSTEIGGGAGSNGGFANMGNASYFRPSVFNATTNFLDSPSTTSAVTYKIQANTQGTIYINYPQLPNSWNGGNTCSSSITVLELA